MNNTLMLIASTRWVLSHKCSSQDTGSLTLNEEFFIISPCVICWLDPSPEEKQIINLPRLNENIPQGLGECQQASWDGGVNRQSTLLC